MAEAEEILACSVCMKETTHRCAGCGGGICEEHYIEEDGKIYCASCLRRKHILEQREKEKWD